MGSVATADQADLSEVKRVALSLPPTESWLPYLEKYKFLKGFFFFSFISLLDKTEAVF